MGTGSSLSLSELCDNSARRQLRSGGKMNKNNAEGHFGVVYVFPYKRIIANAGNARTKLPEGKEFQESACKVAMRMFQVM